MRGGRAGTEWGDGGRGCGVQSGRRSSTAGVGESGRGSECVVCALAGGGGRGENGLVGGDGKGCTPSPHTQTHPQTVLAAAADPKIPPLLHNSAEGGYGPGFQPCRVVCRWEGGGYTLEIAQTPQDPNPKPYLPPLHTRTHSQDPQP